MSNIHQIQLGAGRVTRVARQATRHLPAQVARQATLLHLTAMKLRALRRVLEKEAAARRRGGTRSGTTWSSTSTGS